nr:unnamed protein product [Callosobruchus analis]
MLDLLQIPGITTVRKGGDTF